MSPIGDPEKIEAKHLIAATQFIGKKVLEIGCGKASLTWRYANIAQKVYGIDPSLSDLRAAKSNQPVSLLNVLISQAIGEALPFSSGIFEIALFSSSL
ncbi:MAG TPA: class I SAM-dependent methyltransferase [Anaerolineales bacterium]